MPLWTKIGQAVFSVKNTDMKKKLFIICLCAALMVPAYAVFNEKNISRTISVLRHELHLAWNDKQEQDRKHEKSTQMAEVQHKNMMDAVKRINELSLILYSQEKDFTLDQTYAMDEVNREYETLNKRRRPRYMNIENIDAEIERYQRLLEALRLLPPKLDAIEEVPDTLRRELDTFDFELESLNAILDSLLYTFSPIPLPVQEEEKIETDTTAVPETESKTRILFELAQYGKTYRKELADSLDSDSFVLSAQAQEDRDSCIEYAKSIIQSYTRQKERIAEDRQYFTDMSHRLQQTYDYSKTRFEEIQKYIFVTGQEKYFSVLANLKRYRHDVRSDMEQKYGAGEAEQDREELRESQWRGFQLLSSMIYCLWHLLVILLAVTLLSCVFLKNIRPFNTEWFKKTRPLVITLAVSIIYSAIIYVKMWFPMNNFMLVGTSLLLVYFWFVIAILLSILVSLKTEDARDGFVSFLPVLVLGLLIMFFRAIFLPDKAINLILTPILLIFLVWQIHALRKFRGKGYKVINRLQVITAVVFGLSLVFSIEGYSLFDLMFIMWWIFQVTVFATITSANYLLKYYAKKSLLKKKEKYACTHKMVSKDEDGDLIRVTWLYDFASRALIPAASILSVLGCIWLAAGVFNITESCNTIFHKPFFDFTNADGNQILQVSLFKLVTVSAFFFLFRYLNYLTCSLYRVNKFEKVMNASGNEFVRKNDVNLTLAYNVIGIIIWGLFTLYAINIMKIPLGAISIVAAGLATGIGLALKDVLNNFIYGIQLMSGRLRVGDIVECDGIRGTVEKISYQSTEILTLNESVISFTNSTLFNKNFQNLTKNTPYEYVPVVISISYGEDVDKVRKLVLDEMEDFKKRRDKYGRYLVERKGGIWITLDEFGDSSVNLAIKQRVLVESKYSYVAEVKERVYKLFNDNGIVIPFPQQEISILNLHKDF